MVVKAKTVRVAAVQMESKNRLIEANLEHATRFVEKAAQKGAKLIILPEFMPTGYIFTTAIWDAAETKEGPTVSWLKENSKKLGISLGTSFLEAEGEDFFNTFVMTTPNGEEAGRVRKQTPAFAEAYFTKGDAGSHVINTELGKIGVGICYENLLAYIPQIMFQQSVNLLLMPHSAPLPTPNFLFPRKQVEFFKKHLKNLAQHYANLLGIPVIMINKCGQWQSPIPGMPFLPQDSSFPGLSAIADSDGSVKAQLGDKEGVIVEDITLDSSRKTHTQPQCQGRWAMKLPWQIRQWRLVEAIGSIWYIRNSKRKKKALEVSSSG